MVRNLTNRLTTIKNGTRIIEINRKSLNDSKEIKGK